MPRRTDMVYCWHVPNIDCRVSASESCDHLVTHWVSRSKGCGGPSPPYETVDQKRRSIPRCEPRGRNIRMARREPSDRK